MNLHRSNGIRLALRLGLLGLLAALAGCADLSGLFRRADDLGRPPGDDLREPPGSDITTDSFRLVSYQTEHRTVQFRWSVGDQLRLTNLTISWQGPHSGQFSLSRRELNTLYGYRIVGLPNSLSGSQDQYYSFSLSAVLSGQLQVTESVRLLVGPDTDRDGELDILDEDDDNDRVVDSLDACPQGDVGWVSNPTSDYDGDGCRNGEDTDSDNDGFPNADDALPLDACARKDYDSDGEPDSLVPGCASDLSLDADIDGDGVLNSADACPRGLLDWTSGSATDHDGDGCRDDEDPDRDNDLVLNDLDACPRGETGWQSNTG